MTGNEATLGVLKECYDSPSLEFPPSLAVGAEAKEEEEEEVGGMEEEGAVDMVPAFTVEEPGVAEERGIQLFISAPELCSTLLTENQRLLKSWNAFVIISLVP